MAEPTKIDGYGNGLMGNYGTATLACGPGDGCGDSLGHVGLGDGHNLFRSGYGAGTGDGTGGGFDRDWGVEEQNVQPSDGFIGILEVS